ncbi:hypothetical protein ACEQ8H_007805 [Pleosporales sp. CAS-2024a]
MHAAGESRVLGGWNAAGEGARHRQTSIHTRLAWLLPIAFQSPIVSDLVFKEAVSWTWVAHFLRLQSVHDKVGFGLRLLGGTSWCAAGFVFMFMLSQAKNHNSLDERQIGSINPQTANPPNAVERVLPAIPTRSITDAIVNHFLSVFNYRYSAIYGPILTDQYVQWWTDRASGRRLSPDFTCLLLRICAYSVQFLTPSLRKTIEFELACNSQALTDKFAKAADNLAASFETSNITIERVQEQFLKEVRLKSKSRIVDAWHSLGCTIRAAQELGKMASLRINVPSLTHEGIDKDAGIEELSKFDIEIRRRIWTVLYIWDWQMSAWLGRPNLIDQQNLDFKLPNLRLDQSSVEPNLLSPFAHMALQAQLGRRVASVICHVEHGKLPTGAKEVLAAEDECERFIDELPPIFRVEDPDTSFDEQHPYFVFQRHQMHCVIFITMLDFLKPYLIRDCTDVLTDEDEEFRRRGVDIALRLLRVSKNLFDHEFPINAKFHMLSFTTVVMLYHIDNKS